MKTVLLKYTTIIVGEIKVEIPDDSPDAYRDAVRIARRAQPHLRAAQFEMADAPAPETEAKEAEV